MPDGNLRRFPVLCAYRFVSVRIHWHKAPVQRAGAQLNGVRRDLLRLAGVRLVPLLGNIACLVHKSHRTLQIHVAAIASYYLLFM